MDRRNSHVLTAWMFGLGLSGCPAFAEDGGIDLSGVLILQGAYDIDRKAGQRLEFRLEPTLTVDLGKLGSFVSVQRFEVDGYDRLEPGRPDQENRAPMNRRLLIGDQASIQLREAYLQGDIGSFSYRLGKQQIVWGEADGLKVLDVVNPQSFRAFILDDFDVSRIPLWSVNLVQRIGGATVQAVWIPDTTYHEIPDIGATFALTASRFTPPVLARPASPDRPDRAFADSDAGVRISGMWGNWDLSAL